MSWLNSFLQGRSQFVSVNGYSSTPSPVDVGVPQGSVLGPLLFSAYVSPLSYLLSSHGLNHQQYADDTLIYCPIPSVNHSSSVHNFEQCLFSLCHWLASNGLSVNPSKSEAILFSTRQRLLKLHSAGLTSVTVFDSSISLSDTITVLGVTLDSSLSFNKHCANITQSGLYHLRALRHIRPLLSEADAELLACSFVQTRLDYCNALLSNTSARNIKRLQRLQNSLAHITFNSNHATSSSSLLAKHHWLPISSRITYKICSITHSVLSTNQPRYLADILTNYNPPRSLRSSDAVLLTKPRTHLSLTDCSFSVSSPAAWNSLSPRLRTISCHATFCRNLKSELYPSSFHV